MILQDHRTWVWNYSTRNGKFIVTLKLIQLLRKCICKDLGVLLLNAVSLKEIEQVVFVKLNFKDHNII